MTRPPPQVPAGLPPGSGVHGPGAHHPEALDTGWLRRSFERAAATLEDTGELSAAVRETLLGRLDLARLVPRRVLDLGAGSGEGAVALKRRYPAAEVIAVDAAHGPLRRALARRRWLRPIRVLCADAQRLPLADGSIDLIVSHFMLPFCEVRELFGELCRVLAPRGYLGFSTLGPDTLKELRAAWARVDEAPHVQRFLDMHDVGDALLAAGFAAPVLDVDHFSVRYESLAALLRDLRASGARNALRGRTRGLTTPRRIAALAEAYEPFRIEGRLPASVEVIFGQAWGPEQRTRSGPQEAGVARVPLTAIGHRARIGYP